MRAKFARWEQMALTNGNLNLLRGSKVNRRQEDPREDSGQIPTVTVHDRASTSGSVPSLRATQVTQRL